MIGNTAEEDSVVTTLRRIIWLIVFSAAGASSLAKHGIAEDTPRIETETLVRWEEGNATADAPVEVVPFRGVRGGHFKGEKGSHVDLGQGAGGRLRVRGALTIRAELEIPAAPREKAAVVSKWMTRDRGRSYELGLDASRRVFFAVSASGNYDDQAKELTSRHRVPIGKACSIAAVYDPGRRMAVYINGHLSAESAQKVPESIFDSDTPVWIGGRAGPGQHLRATIGAVLLDRAALSGDAVAAWTKKTSLTDRPETVPPTIAEVLDMSTTRADVPVRAITRGPKMHWFGYYDKFQFDPSDRYLLSMQIDFEHRSPTGDDVVQVGMIDLADEDRWIELGTTRAWCWQQGCMLQWRPGRMREILYNDRQGERFVCHVLDVKTRRKRTLPRAVYHVSPDGRWGLGLDFARLDDMDRGYGYQGLVDPERGAVAPDRSKIYRIDLDTGEHQDLLSLAEIAKIPYPGAQVESDKHYFNHLQWSPDGERFLLLNRWNRKRGGRGTRMFTAAADGSGLRLVNFDSSHYQWRDPQHILIWVGGGYRLFRDDGRAGPGELLLGAPNGHQTFLPGGQWLLTDTYPRGARREQVVYLLHLRTKRIVVLGRFHSPARYKGEWRCDTHPRINRAGTQVVIDSPHGRSGRQQYLIDIAKIVKNDPGESE